MWNASVLILYLSFSLYLGLSLINAEWVFFFNFSSSDGMSGSMRLIIILFDDSSISCSSKNISSYLLPQPRLHKFASMFLECLLQRKLTLWLVIHSQYSSHLISINLNNHLLLLNILVEGLFWFMWYNSGKTSFPCRCMRIKFLSSYYIWDDKSII